MVPTPWSILPFNQTSQQHGTPEDHSPSCNWVGPGRHLCSSVRMSLQAGPPLPSKFVLLPGNANDFQPSPYCPPLLPDPSRCLSSPTPVPVCPLYPHTTYPKPVQSIHPQHTPAQSPTQKPFSLAVPTSYPSPLSTGLPLFISVLSRVGLSLPLGSHLLSPPHPS